MIDIPLHDADNMSFWHNYTSVSLRGRAWEKIATYKSQSPGMCNYDVS